MKGKKSPLKRVDSAPKGLDEVAERLGAKIAYRQKRGPVENAVLRFTSARPDWATRPVPPAVVAASDRVQEAFQAVLRRLKSEHGSRELVAEVMTFATECKNSYDLSFRALSDLFGETLDDLKLLNREAARATGELRVKNNPAAKAKAEAKAEAEKLWNEWSDTKPRRTWTNEQFALEAMRRWPGKFASIAVVVGWIPGWKKTRAERGSND